MGYSHSEVDEVFHRVCICGGGFDVRNDFADVDRNRNLIKNFSLQWELFDDGELMVFDRKNRAQWPYMWDFLQEHVKVNGPCDMCKENRISHCLLADKIICESGMRLGVNASGFVCAFPENTHNVQYMKFEVSGGDIGKKTALDKFTRELLKPYVNKHAETEYAYVPFYIVAGIIIMHGGVSVKTFKKKGSDR